MKKILVTGAAGFIGSNMCKFLLNKDYFVIGFDNFLTGTKKNIKELLTNDKFIFIEADICEGIDIEGKIDYILHFASTASPKDYLKYPIKTLDIGSVGTKVVLDLAIKKKSTVMVASTSEIYGDPLEHPQKESYYGNVNPIGPRGVYDEAKRFLEALTMAYHTKLGLDIRIARIFNTYGPKMRINDGRAIPNFINQALIGKKFTIYGDGKQTRSFCYIDDTILGIYSLMKSDYKMPLNIGNPDEHSILELISIINTLIPNDCKFLHKPLPLNDPKLRRPDISKAKTILDWNPKISLREGLLKTINYFKLIEK